MMLLCHKMNYGEFGERKGVGSNLTASISVVLRNAINTICPPARRSQRECIIADFQKKNIRGVTRSRPISSMMFPQGGL